MKYGTTWYLATSEQWPSYQDGIKLNNDTETQGAPTYWTYDKLTVMNHNQVVYVSLLTEKYGIFKND